MSRAIASVQREAGNPGQAPHPVWSLPPFSGPWGLAAPKKVFLRCAEGILLRDGLLGPAESSNNYRAQCRSSQAAWNQAQAQGQPPCPHVFKACVLMSQPHRLLPPPATLLSILPGGTQSAGLTRKLAKAQPLAMFFAPWHTACWPNKPFWKTNAGPQNIDLGAFYRRAEHCSGDEVPWNAPGS